MKFSLTAIKYGLWIFFSPQENDPGSEEVQNVGFSLFGGGIFDVRGVSIGLCRLGLQHFFRDGPEISWIDIAT